MTAPDGTPNHNPEPIPTRFEYLTRDDSEKGWQPCESDDHNQHAAERWRAGEGVTLYRPIR